MSLGGITCANQKYDSEIIYCEDQKTVHESNI